MRKGYLITLLVLCSWLAQAEPEAKVTIRISGTVALDFGEIDPGSEKAKALAGLHYDGETLAEYIGCTTPDKPFQSIGLTGGHVTLEFNKRLWVVTEYQSPRYLTAKEMTWLIDYTQGQWSDGVGENPQQMFALPSWSPVIELAPVDQLIKITTR